MARYDPNIVNTIVRVGKQMGYGPREITAALSTGIVESGLRNLGHLGNRNDHDSLGVFQQRPSQGWGTPAQLTNVEYAARKFYSSIPQFDRQGISGAELAARIQRPARQYRHRYAQRWNEAESLLRAFGGGRGAGSDRALANRTAPNGRVPIGMNRTARRRMVNIQPSAAINLGNPDPVDPTQTEPTVQQDMDMWGQMLAQVSSMMQGNPAERASGVGNPFSGTAEEESDFGLERALGELYQAYGPSKRFLADFDLTDADLDDLPTSVRQQTLQRNGGLPPNPEQGSGALAIQIAQQYLGVPYLWGGVNPQKGLDCSGLIQLVYKQMGINLPRFSGHQMQSGKKVNSLAEAQPGDLVGKPGHVALYMGNGQILHAPRTGKNVEIRNLYFKPTSIRRFV